MAEFKEMPVYFIQQTSGDRHIKIGCSDKPNRRLSALQTASSVELKLLAKYLAISQKKLESRVVLQLSVFAVNGLNRTRNCWSTFVTSALARIGVGLQPKSPLNRSA